ncbi:MAG: NAD-dependent epimerase/dehydratase family protein [Deltaproteobacteria bacterium]|nr:NAD-dependent epimerase/dehydratase family protein [Deltaproteobacteria bacterium]
MKTIITGGAGFIGSHLSDRLLARGDQVLVIDNYATGRRDNLTPQKGLTVVEGSIADRALVHDAFSSFSPDVVVHAAASYKDPENWEEDSRTNATGTAIITQEAKASGVKRLIYFQTALCYGIKPIEQPITLTHPIMPGDSSYAISKTAGEYYIALSGMDYISFRLANAYGPRNLSGPLPTFFQRLTTGKACFVMDTRRDFIFVNDLVDCVMGAVDGKGERGAYHISSGSDFSIKELFDATIKALGITLEKDVEQRPRGADDAYTILLDPSKTERDFGWRVTTPLETGVAAAISYYKEFGISQTYTHLKAHSE